ncbi:MAG: TldD/PmbA family protein [Candidatus Saccharicenans sp.]|uniref:TldD/PmbA family protein n=1 Tax=Candidatus Saccharicenans sp. TaxID=2819258 RepID=UPI0040492305
MDYRAIAEEVVKICRKKGADQAEAYLVSGRELSLEVRNGQVESIQEAGSYGLGLRVISGHRLGFAFVNDFRPESLEETVNRALNFARILTADENNVLPDDPGLTEVKGLYDPGLAAIPMDRKIALAREVECLDLKVQGISKSSGASYGESETEIVLASSLGLLKSYKNSGCGFGVRVIAEKGEQKSSGYESCQRRFFSDLKPAAEIASRAAEQALMMLDPRPVKTQRAAIILDPDVAYAILGGIIQAINGERVLQGASFLGQKLGQKIASDLITIIDDGTLEKGLASAPFDGEGVPTQKRLVVDRGVLQGFLYNTYAARRAGVKSTGNASRGGFDRLPGIGPHNFYIAAGETKLEDIIAATDRGVLVKEITGYGINPVNGNFSGGAAGLWIENGKIAFPVKGITIAGTADEMLNGIDLLGNDLDLNRSRTAPTLRIKSLQIGGE